MADYTKLNVDEITDQAEEYGMGELQEARFGTKEIGATQVGFGHQRVKPGKRQGFGHKHDEAEEIYYVVSGSGRAKLDDEIIDLAAGDVLRVAAPVMRRFEAGDEGLEYLSFGARHEGDGDIDPGFWAPEE